jgi:hypothetical protein
MKENLFLKVVSWLAGSADNMPGGASSKKLSAFWALVVLSTIVTLTWTIWAYKHNNWSHLEYVLTALLAFSAAGLSINMVEKLKGKANASEKEPPTNPPA